MSLLEQAETTVNGWGAERTDDRARCIALLEQIGTLMEEALAIWQHHLVAPMEPDPRRTITTLVRPEDAKRLNDLHFKVKDAARRLMELTGTPFIDTFDLCEELSIELAYRQLKLGETLSYVTVKAVENQNRRREAVRTVLSGIQTSA